MRTDKAVKQILAAFFRFAGHPGIHLDAVIAVEVVDEVVVGLGIAAFFIEVELIDVLGGLVLQLDRNQFITRIAVVGGLAGGNDFVHLRNVFGIIVGFLFPLRDIGALLHGQLVIHFQRLRERPGRVAAVFEDNIDFHRGIRFTDDVDVLLVVLFINILVFPAGFDNAVALVFRTLLIDIDFVDGYAGLVLDIESKRSVSDFFRCGFLSNGFFRCGFLCGLFGSGGLFCGSFRNGFCSCRLCSGRGGRGGSARNKRKDHQQSKND